MTALRHVSRHVHKTLADLVIAQLKTLGWGDASLPATDPVNTQVNFGATPCTYMTVQPAAAGTELKPNMVSITLGEEPPAADQEMGSERGALDYPLFVDVYGEDLAVTNAILDDVRHTILDNLVTPVLNQTAQPPTDSGLVITIDRETISKRVPTVATGASDQLKRNWRVVVATANVDNLWAV